MSELIDQPPCHMDFWRSKTKAIKSIRKLWSSTRQAKEEGRVGYLRNDLEALRAYFGKRTLVEGLRDNKINRVLEVGTGPEFNAIKQLVLLKVDDRPFLRPENVWVVDSLIDENRELEYGYTKGKIGRHLGGFSIAREGIGIFAKRIDKKFPPFDLIFCRGVVSETNKEIIGDMMLCLNPNNPNAVIMIACTYKDGVLPYTDGRF